MDTPQSWLTKALGEKSIKHCPPVRSNVITISSHDFEKYLNIESVFKKVKILKVDLEL